MLNPLENNVEHKHFFSRSSGPVFHKQPLNSFFVSLRICCSILLCVLTFSGTGFSATTSQEKPGSIVFLPFSISSDTPQQYLKEGLPDILASRISNRTGLRAIHKNTATRQLTRLMEQGDLQALKSRLTAMQAGHLIIGTLEQQKTDFEILIYLFSKQRATPATFSKTLTSLSEVIPALNELSIDISDQILHKKHQTNSVHPTPEADGTSAFQTAHPDRAFREGLYKPAKVTAASGAVDQANTFLAKTKITGEAVALAVGDINNDSIEDIALLEHGKIAIYHLENNTFQQISQHHLPKFLSPHAINLADFNGNGLLEIYISANSGNRPTSLVLEWDGSTFHTLQQSIPYYLRPGLNQRGEQVLIGQRGGTVNPVSPYFYQLELTADGTIKKKGSLPVPEGFNLFDFIRLDLDGDGEPEIAGIRQNNQLVLLDKTGQTLWESDLTYGASKTFLGDVTRDRAGDRTLFFMHSRLIAKDVNGDDHPEIIVGQNRVSTVQYFKQLRFFRGTSVNVLRWNGSSLTSLWQTPLNKRYTADYQVAPKSGQADGMRLYSLETENSSPLFFWKTDQASLQYMELP